MRDAEMNRKQKKISTNLGLLQPFKKKEKCFAHRSETKFILSS